MKRITCLLLALLLLCSFALAESENPASEQERAAAFSFRNGIHWGMTPEEVQAAEGREPDHSASRKEHVWAIGYEDVTVSRYAGALAYLYRDDKLFCALYYIEAEDAAASHRYLKLALSSLYGEAVETEPYVINRFMNDIDGSDQEYQLSDCFEWHAADGTIIWQASVSNYIYIFYIAPGFDGSQMGAYDVTGL